MNLLGFTQRVMSLRLKFEYLKEAMIPNTDEFCRKFMLTEPILAKYAPQSIVLAPGPFYRGIEMTSEIVDGPRSQISKQVNNGVAVRMALLYLLARRQGFVFSRGKRVLDLDDNRSAGDVA